MMRLSHVFKWRGSIRYWDVPLNRERMPPAKLKRRQCNVLEHQAAQIELIALRDGRRICQVFEQIINAALDREERARADAA